MLYSTLNVDQIKKCKNNIDMSDSAVSASLYCYMHATASDIHTQELFALCAAILSAQTSLLYRLLLRSAALTVPRHTGHLNNKANAILRSKVFHNFSSKHQMLPSLSGSPFYRNHYITTHRETGFAEKHMTNTETTNQRRRR